MSSHRPSGRRSPSGEVVVAGSGRDREAGRDRQAGVRHLGEARALAAEQVPHRRVALRLAAAERVDVAARGAVRSVEGRCGLGHGRRSFDGRPVRPGQVRWAPAGATDGRPDSTQRRRALDARGPAAVVAAGCQFGTIVRTIRRCPRPRPLHRFRRCWRPPVHDRPRPRRRARDRPGRAPVQRVDRQAGRPAREPDLRLGAIRRRGHAVRVRAST